MKQLILFFFFLVNYSLAQQTPPIAESNYFIYNKNNYGYDIPNPSQGVLDYKGRLWTKPYAGKYKIVENTKIKEPYLGALKNYPEISALFRIKNKDYLCTNSNILVFENDSLVQNIPLTEKLEEVSHFTLYQNKIYYIKNLVYNNENTTKAYCYDLQKKHKIFEQKEKHGGASLFKIGNQLYLNTVANSASTVFEVNHHLKKIQTIPFPDYKTAIIDYKNSLKNYEIYHHSNKIDIYKNHKLVKTIYYPKNYYFHYYQYFFTNSNQIQGIYHLSNLSKPIFNSFYDFNIIHLIPNKPTNSYFAGNGGQLIRFFPHIKKYPILFNGTNSAQVFTMAQTPDSKLWFGSYNGFLTTVERNTISKAPIDNLRFLNGNVTVGNKLLLFTESEKGSYLFSTPNQYQKILDKNVFFYGYKAKNGKYYLGSMKEGLFEIEPKYFETFNKKYIHIKDKNHGLKLRNIVTISEDKFGNIWMGQKGIAVYNPRKNKIITWHTDDNPEYFRSMASLQDSYQTLWFGNSSGELAYYNGKNADDLKFENFKKINHPLLRDNPNPITFLHQWKNYLIIGAEDRILLFDIEKWNKNKKIAVRYLNAQETNFSTPTEQNTLLTDHRDQSIWFSTSDMVYQWDIEKWLDLPIYKIKPSLVIKKDSVKKTILPNTKISFKPIENSFDLEIEYQSPDNLPRYINSALVKKGKKPVFDYPSLETSFHFANLSSGNYIFYVRVCQQDGSFDVFEYPIFIDSFIWQKWWFWAIMALFPIGFVFFYYREKREIEKTKKKLAQLNLASLSNQFRPHFMLNALNSIASQMENMPNAEKVISKLGDSINVLYGFSQKNEFTHHFSDEWKLVENFIEIQKILYLPELETHITNFDIFPKDYRLPVGLLQIPVENALLHGLINKESGDYTLKINFSENKKFYFIEIVDNGIGRKKSAEIHQYKKNGKGLKTIKAMIDIINQYSSHSISLKITDLVNNEGTIITLALKKNTDNGKIEL